MQRSTSPTIFSFLPTIMFLLVTGWGGVAVLVISYPPTVWPRWLFFFFSVLAVTGTALPFVAFLNRRFPSVPPAEAHIVVRQAIWVGIYLPTLAWLQIPRVLTLAQVLMIRVSFIILESLIRLRERSQWTP
jgi:hypothetical protein